MTPETRPEGRLEVGELRERLRALGYLDAGVDRFVLAPATGARSTIGLAWRVSLRIGLLAALLLGPAAAIGVAARLPGLIAGPRDAVVVTIYLGIIFGIGATIVSFLAGLAVSAVARRTAPATARRLAVTAAWLIGMACLAYLTMWWNATGAAWTAPVRTLVAIAAAVGISLLVGHAVLIATMALIARQQAASAARAPVLSWAAMVAIAVVAFLGASGLLAWSSGSATATFTPSPSFAVIPTGVRVIVIGIDGFDPELLSAPSGPKGLNVLGALRTEGIRATGPVDDDPARVWTTVATGVPAREHGVSGLELRRVAGLEGAVGASPNAAPSLRALAAVSDLARLTRPAPLSGTTRRHKTFWDVAAEKGLDAVVVNWWATWPATNTKATVISDRALLRLERGGPQNAEIAPESLYEPLRARWSSIKERARAAAKAGLPGGIPRDVFDVLLRSATLDAEQVLIARDPLLGHPDVLAVYLPGLDIAQHSLLQQTGGVSLSPSSMAGRVEALSHYYVFLDRLLHDWLMTIPQQAVTLTIAHPGRVGGERYPLMWLRGGPADERPSARAVPRSLAVVNALVSHLVGLPVSREVEQGRWELLLNEEWVEAHPIRYVDTYGRYTAEVPTEEGKPLDQETLERLRSLGYIR